MKALLLVLFAFAAVFNVPAPCAHTLGLAGGHAPVQKVEKPDNQHATAQEHGAHSRHSHMTHGPAAHDHARHDSEKRQYSDHMDHGAPSHTDEHHGCEEGCDGGANCQGCFMTAASIDADASIDGPDLAPAHRAFAKLTADGAAAGAEPPPPRA